MKKPGHHQKVDLQIKSTTLFKSGYEGRKQTKPFGPHPLSELQFFRLKKNLVSITFDILSVLKILGTPDFEGQRIKKTRYSFTYRS